jgi:hypothetical protein
MSPTFGIYLHTKTCSDNNCKILVPYNLHSVLPYVISPSWAQFFVFRTEYCRQQFVFKHSLSFKARDKVSQSGLAQQQCRLNSTSAGLICSNPYSRSALLTEVFVFYSVLPGGYTKLEDDCLLFHASVLFCILSYADLFGAK